jgi:hypothetical protein
MSAWPGGLSTGCFYRTNIRDCLKTIRWLLGALETTDVGVCLDTGHGYLRDIARRLTPPTDPR